MDEKSRIFCILEGDILSSMQLYELSIKSYYKAIEDSSLKILSLKKVLESYIKLNQTNKIIYVIDELIKLNPNDFELYLKKGSILFKTKQYQKALDNYNIYLDKNPDDPEIYKLLGESYSNIQNYEKALDNYNIYLDKNPDDPEIYKLLGESYSNIQNYEKALDNYNIYLDKNPDDPEIYKLLGDTYFYKKEYENASTNYKLAMKYNPNYTDIDGVARPNKTNKNKKYLFSLNEESQSFLKTGVLFYYQKDYDNSILNFTEGINRDPYKLSDYRSFNNRGAAYCQKGNYYNAMEDFNKSIEINPNCSEALFNKGLLYYKKGDYFHSLIEFNKLLEIDLYEPNTIYLIYKIYFLLSPSQRIDINKKYPKIKSIIKDSNNEDIEGKISDNFKLIIIEKDEAEYYYKLGMKYLYNKKFNQAIDCFDISTEKYPFSYLTYFSKGCAYYNIEKYEKAIDNFDIAQEISGDTYISLDLGNAYFHIGDYENALLMYDKCYNEYKYTNLKYLNLSDLIELYDKKGTILFYKNNYELAIEYYTKAIDLVSDNSKLYMMRGLARLKKGNYSNAIEDLSQAINLDSSNYEIYKHRALLYTILDNYIEAVNDYTTFIEYTTNKSTYYALIAFIKSFIEDYELAIEYYTKAIDLVSDNSKLYMMRGLARLKKGNYSNAIEDLSQAINLDSSNIWILKYLLDFCLTNEEKKKILFICDSLDYMNITQNEVWYNMMLIYSDLNQFNKVDILFHKLTKSFTNDINSIIRLNELYYKINNYEKEKDKTKINKLELDLKILIKENKSYDHNNVNSLIIAHLIEIKENLNRQDEKLDRNLEISIEGHKSTHQKLDSISEILTSMNGEISSIKKNGEKALSSIEDIDQKMDKLSKISDKIYKKTIKASEKLIEKNPEKFNEKKKELLEKFKIPYS